MIFIAKQSILSFRDGIHVVFTMVICASACIGIAWYFYPWKSPPLHSLTPPLSKSQQTYSIPLDAIGNGPLSLQPKIGRGWIARIVQNVSIVGMTTRPDFMQRKIHILVGTEGVVVDNEQTLYLQEEPLGHTLRLSSAPAQFWVKPILLKSNEVLIEMGRFLAVGEEKGEYITHVTSTALDDAEMLIKLFQNARYLEKDELYERYRENHTHAKKLLFIEGEKTYGLYVSPGDFLQYVGNEWKVCHESLDSNAPLVTVREINANEMVLQGWNNVGICTVPFRIPKEIAVLTPQADLLPGKAQVTPRGLVLCYFGPRQFVLREQDWLLHTAGSWQYIRRSADKEKVLEHRLKGTLFVCDRLERTRDGFFVQGSLFNELHTLCQHISFPIETMRKEKG